MWGSKPCGRRTHASEAGPARKPDNREAEGESLSSQSGEQVNVPALIGLMGIRWIRKHDLYWIM